MPPRKELRIIEQMRDPAFWDGIAWVTRMNLVFLHVLFGVMAIVRQNLPLLFAGYSAFDDNVPFYAWGLWNLLAAFLLFVIPTRVPFGLLSTLVSSFLMFWMGSMFWESAQFVFASGSLYFYGAWGTALFMRALWLYMVRVRWFQQYVLRDHHG